MGGEERVEPDPSDIRATDWAVGLLVAALVMGVAAAALEAAHLGRRADVPPIEAGLGIPIAVEPVLEHPAASRGGPAVQTPTVPRVRPRPRARGRGATPPSDASVDAPAELPASPEGRAGAARRPPGPATSDAPGLPSLPSVDDPADPSPDPSGPSDDDTPGPAVPDADGDPSGPDDGPADASGSGPSPLEAQAIAAYRERLSRWLSARFTVTGSGLTQAELLRHRVRALVRISADGSVESYEVIPSGNAAFDQGAKEALESVMGEPLPPAPDHYPRAVQQQLKVTFVCKKSQCS